MLTTPQYAELEPLHFVVVVACEMISWRMMCFNEPESPVDRVHLSFGCRARFAKAGLGTDEGPTKTKVNSQIILAELISALMAVLCPQILLEFCGQWKLKTLLINGLK